MANLPRIAALLLVLGLLSGCFGGGGSEADDDLVHGTIAYPFVDETRPLAVSPPKDRFIIRSAVGAKEYTIEIPGAAEDYDVQVPIADLGEKDADVLSGTRPKGVGNPLTTDKEIVAALPRLDKDRAADTALLDQAFGTSSPEGPRQSPSYTLSIAKINERYKRHEYEFCLVEINNLLTFYPNAPLLHKMKGTVLVKMRNLKLAELAWIKALELDPRDQSVRASLERLQKRLVATGQTPQGQPLSTELAVPKPVGTPPVKPQGLLGPGAQP